MAVFASLRALRDNVSGAVVERVARRLEEFARVKTNYEGMSHAPYARAAIYAFIDAIAGDGE